MKFKQVDTLKIKYFLLILMLFVPDLIIAQSYELTLNQRRRFDQIHVEVWAKGTAEFSPKLGYASLVIQYNSDILKPAAAQSPSKTDSIQSNVDVSNPVVDINSEFHNINGYSSLGSGPAGNGFYSLEINLKDFGIEGKSPGNEGRGSFLGKMIFDIQGDPKDTTLTKVEWSKSTLPGDIRIFDADSNDIESSVVFTDPNPFTIIGITVLSPNFPGQTVDRNRDYASLKGAYASGGYPIYFERSVNPNNIKSPATSPPAIDPRLGYLIEYSSNGGNTFTEIGRLAETDRPATQVGKSLNYISGDIFDPGTAVSYTVTTQKGDRVLRDNYREPIRVIWAKDRYFAPRSEQARLRISRLKGSIDEQIRNRFRENISDTSDFNFVLGRLFFAQLDGTNKYFKTAKNFSNSTQLTVEAWINLNELKGANAETGIVASSAGTDATPVFGSREGAWMLYLHAGQYPAFRVRELLGRGDSTFLAKIIAHDPLSIATDVNPLIESHSNNWVHLAATVDNNTVTLFVNGEIEERVSNDSDNDLRMLTTLHPVWIGINPNTSLDNGDYLHAGIKEVRVWRTALKQDQIRKIAAGVVNPADVSKYGDLRRGLELYYTFKGTNTDIATDTIYQNAIVAADYYINGVKDNSKIYYRPDQPHVRFTAPVSGNGIGNLDKDIFDIRWVSFGVGNIAAVSNDIDIQFTTDAGSTWQTVIDPTGKELSGATAPDIETGNINWEPYRSVNLRSINPFSRKAVLRFLGTDVNRQNGLDFRSDQFTIAPYFAAKKSNRSIIMIPGDKGMNITGDVAVFESWIRPYRFPNETEGFFPIIAKYDSVSGNEHYSLRLLTDGRLQFNINDLSGNTRTAFSAATALIQRPNSVAIDTPWTHVAVYVFTNGGKGKSEVRFFIDGNVQKTDSIVSQLGDTLKPNSVNNYPTFIGYYPTGGEAIGFIGEIREVRFWNGLPGNKSPSGIEPTELSTFIQGASAVRADKLDLNSRINLYSAYSFNGNSFIHNGYNNSVRSANSPSIFARQKGWKIEYVPTEPYLKLVEPVFRQEVSNSKKDVRVRWTGFDYDGTDFSGGSSAKSPSIEYSIRGGGGNIIQPYQYVGSLYWTNNKVNSMSFPDLSKFIFKGTGKDIYIASNLDVSIADPDERKDGSFIQGPLSASLTNARLRLTGKYTVFGQSRVLRSEGQLFTVTPASNFTVRALLEGYHDGAVSGKFIKNLAPTYDEGGVKITILQDNAGVPGAVVDSAESKDGYDELNPLNRNAGNNRFANINFIFTDLTNNNFWVLVEQLNHLPVLSRYPATFIYEGDQRGTWRIESGWDFTSWNGVANNVLTDRNNDPWDKNQYSAWGDATNEPGAAEYSTTGLIFNNGKAGGDKNQMPALVGGDIVKDGQINAADRVQVRKDAGGHIRSDITGDGIVNSDDRTIVDRNFGKISSVYELDLESMIEEGTELPEYLISAIGKDPFNVIDETDIEMSLRFNKNTNKSNTGKDIVLANYKYSVEADPILNGETVDLDLYIQNKLDVFALANCTFAITYNSNYLEYDTLIEKQRVIFSDVDSIGYGRIWSAPKAGTPDPLPNVRTIEIDYDAFANPGGVNVPYGRTYLGTLRFNLKSKDHALEFDWHKSTSIHTTNSEIITDDGDFKDIDPKVPYFAKVTHPNGGETFRPEQEIEVNWITDGKAFAYIEYSTNAKNSWKRVVPDSVKIDVKSVQWKLPVVSSGDCYVRIIDAATLIALDTSDGPFSIFPPFAQLIKPSSGDAIYHGGEKSLIRWASQGYSKFDFELSTNGGTDWDMAAKNVPAKDLETNWTVPRVSTKAAKMRMIDTESGKSVAESGLFKIINGSLQFREPRTGDKFKIGRQTRIRWLHEFVDTVDLQLSTNGGNSWEFLQPDVATIRGYLDWIVEDKPTNAAVIRALWNADPEMEYDRTGVFTIEQEPDDVKDVLPSGWAVGKIFPNPSNSEGTFTIQSPSDEHINIKICDINGKAVLRDNIFRLHVGENIIKIDVKDFAQGSYLIIIEAKKFIYSHELKITR